MTTATRSPYLRDQSDFDAAFVDALMLVVPAAVAGNVIKHPLTHDQSGALRALAEHGDGDFCWSNPSTTQRLLNALVNKGLAKTATIKDRYGRDREVFRPIPEVRQFHLDRERERQADYQARSKAEAEANRAKHAALSAALEEEKAVLLAGLDALGRAALLDPEIGARARARVESMGVPTWGGHW